jgi:tetratricopeptide (TPR) repeat protein
MSNAVVAWLIILFSSLITHKISQSKVAAFITVILFLVSARFMGHAMNNLKDIPFTFAFIFSIYFIFRFVVKLPKISWIDLGLLTQGIAFGISIRIGGLLIFAYFVLFTSLYLYFLFVSGKIEKDRILILILKLGILSFFVLLLSFFSSILIWPFALENPLVNPLTSLDLMHQYPTTVRQVFEGKLYWSNMFPWYYLSKYLLITIPLVVLLGFVACIIFVGNLKKSNNITLSLFLLIACGFPLFYTSVSGANVYGGWRQLLFCYPPMVVLASIGIWALFDLLKEKKNLRVAAIIVTTMLLFHPIKYSFLNYPYLYIYFNQLVGGTGGAYGNYELDYYFTSFKKAYEFIDSQEETPEIVAANFIIPEYYKGKPYKHKLIDYYDRSSTDWDYAIICNTFLDPYQLKEGIWPPTNTVYIVQADEKPILAILKRETKADLKGIQLMNAGDYAGAIEEFIQALKIDKNNESILLNLARAHLKLGDNTQVNANLNRLLTIYPDNEWAMDLKGKALLVQGKDDEAVALFQKNIGHNHKFYHSYVSLANAYILQGETDEAIKYLKACLRINPFYEPAYKIYGQLLIDRGEVELGTKMLNFAIEGNSKYGRK